MIFAPFDFFGFTPKFNVGRFQRTQLRQLKVAVAPSMSQSFVLHELSTFHSYGGRSQNISNTLKN